jgi:RNA polymerase sigma-70 factor, ECF subfamily
LFKKIRPLEDSKIFVQCLFNFSLANIIQTLYKPFTGENKTMNKLQTALSEGSTRSRLVNVTRRIMKTEADSEDAAHDAIVLALRNAGDFRADAQATTWMHRIAVNAALMTKRGSGRRGRYMDTLATHSLAAIDNPVVPQSEPDAETKLCELAMRRVLRDAVANLDEPYREVVQRCVYDEQPAEDAARDLGLTSAAVRTRLLRARTQLESMLRPDVEMQRAA